MSQCKIIMKRTGKSSGARDKEIECICITYNQQTYAIK